jgi:hypothetical protein
LTARPCRATYSPVVFSTSSLLQEDVVVISVRFNMGLAYILFN